MSWIVKVGVRRLDPAELRHCGMRQGWHGYFTGAGFADSQSRAVRFTQEGWARGMAKIIGRRARVVRLRCRRKPKPATTCQLCAEASR